MDWNNVHEFTILVSQTKIHVNSLKAKCQFSKFRSLASIASRKLLRHNEYLFIYIGERQKTCPSSHSLRDGEVQILGRFLEKAASTECICADNIEPGDNYLGLRDASRALDFGGGPAILPSLLLVLVLALAPSRGFPTTSLFVLPIFLAIIVADVLIPARWHVRYRSRNWIVDIRCPSDGQLLRRYTLLFTATFHGRCKLGQSLRAITSKRITKRKLQLLTISSQE